MSRRAPNRERGTARPAPGIAPRGQPPGGLYATDFFVAASASSGVSNTTVRVDATPDWLTASATAAAVTLPGRSAITQASTPPNAIVPAWRY